ncbi:MAG: proteasome accessory factor PafA2 family protein, partial [Patescibacteria group bacterium]
NTLDVQSIFFEAVRAQLTSATYASDEIEAEVTQIMLYWEQTLNAFYNNDNEWKRGRIDHATKQYIAETYIRKQKISNTSELSLIYKTIDIMYHCVSNPTMQQQIKNKWRDRRIVDDNEINHAILHAPQNTRARMRGMFVQALFDKGKRVSDDLDWSRLSVNHGEQHNVLQLLHGLVANSDEFEKFLLLVEQ